MIGSMAQKYHTVDLMVTLSFASISAEKKMIFLFFPPLHVL